MPDQILCPNGHVSEWPDYCSQCGAAIASASAPAPGIVPPTAPDLVPTSAPQGSSASAAIGVTNGGTCPSCGAPCVPTDVFCEACGADLSTGSAAPVAAPATASASADGLLLEVRADRAYFDRYVDAGALTFPDPPPAPAMRPLTRTELLIGRRSDSRGLFPDVDAQQLTADPAVSHTHALLRQDASGAWSVIDQGSTNGSRLDLAPELLVPGRAYPLAAGSELHVGAWTTIRIVGATADGATPTGAATSDTATGAADGNAAP